eukprot:CAMPEP_0194773484 /NCGR_PEP_ID=MMETSP0323_2-20130528/54984_1 /TAXON_ID=2866 ORGANISM="Crypthecodinium cohnii, Strain Seligo" /NCGR_SAMPLE_ID=MMETSP0323_2 /ASSEMBLY_ACC=CAM_ASM_000346 /LENGTH=51 /DNA_ID=CAMNT_0039708567 /DNA_START=19 /DNA_END=173 /DNA_ORIENTATION=-
MTKTLIRRVLAPSLAPPAFQDGGYPSNGGVRWWSTTDVESDDADGEQQRQV